jgi:hypothetical protein
VSVNLKQPQIANLLPFKLRIKHFPLAGGREYVSSLFVPNKYFNITNNGVYTLKVRMRAWTQDTKGHYGVLVSPAAVVEVEKK